MPRREPDDVRPLASTRKGVRATRIARPLPATRSLASDGTPPAIAIDSAMPGATAAAVAATLPAGSRARIGIARTRPRVGGLTATGALPAVAVIAGLGVLIAGLADRVSRSGGSGADALLWLGILAIVVPGAFRVLRFGTSRTERIGSLLLVGFGLYLVKVMDGGGTFLFGDELTHWRTAADLLATGQPFGPNPLSTVSPSYPGLELVTTAIANLGGISIESSGLVVIGTARIIMILALFLFVERVSGSDRLAGIATLVYAGNPNFAFWSGQFSYESLGLPLAVLVLYLAVRHGRMPALSWRPFEVAALVIVFAIVVTHHVTTYVLLLAFTAWAIASVLRRRVGPDRTPAPLAIAAVTAVAGLAWLIVTFKQTFSYIVPALTIAAVNVIRVFSGQRSIKTLFVGDPSLVSPAWERAVAFLAVALMGVAILAGVVGLWSRLRHFPGRSPASLLPVLAIGALLYLPLQGLRLVAGSTEIANRAGDFLFVPGGIVAAIGTMAIWRGVRARPIRLAAAVGLATVLIAGGIVIGTPLWARLPGPYAVANDTRGIEPQTIATANWVHDEFGPSNAVMGTQAATSVLGSYGFQAPVFGASWVFFSPGFGPAELDALAATGARFVIIDRRITTALPLNGFYFENREPGANRHTEPLPAAELDKIEGVPSLRRIYDNGDLIIYELVPANLRPSAP